MTRPVFGPPVRCQHCPDPIWPTRVPLPGGQPGEVLYENAAGITQCVKARGDLPVPDSARVFHRPLPVVPPAGRS